MDLISLVTDNLTELLVKIIEFTEMREIILNENIDNMHDSGFVPKDLAVDEFSDSLTYAIKEHIRNQRLVLCDSENVKFGTLGSFEVKAVADEDAKMLLSEDRDLYLELQMEKLLENSVNRRFAAELLKHKEGKCSVFD